MRLLPVIFKPLQFEVWMEHNCCSIGRCLVAKSVVFIELLPTKVNTSFEVTAWEMLVLLLELFELSKEIIDCLKAFEQGSVSAVFAA